MIYDVITYNGEKELFDIRYNILKDYVDEFRVIEFDKTFSGKFKNSLHNGEKFFTKNYPKVKIYLNTEELWSKYHDLALSSPNTEYGKGADHWVREFCQKESIKDCLTDLKDDDIVFIGDCDEIWDPERKLWQTPGKMKLKVYSYYLNNRSTEQFWGTLVSQYKDIRGECLNHLRADAVKTDFDGGWHFTSMGGHEKVKQKLTDSYTEATYAHPMILDSLENNIKNNNDFLGRNFTYKLDESEWPQYLKENRDKYKHLLL